MIPGTINSISTDIEVQDYWRKRSEVSELMRKALDNLLKKNQAECLGFQILEV